MTRNGHRYTVVATLFLTLLATRAVVRFVASAPMTSSFVAHHPGSGEAGGLAGKTLSAPAQLQQTAIDAYVYGYPLVTMEMTRRVATNVEKPEGTHAPMGQL